jgi:hypothetical protein
MLALHKIKEWDLSGSALSCVIPTVRDSEQDQQDPRSRSDPLKMTGSTFPRTSSPDDSPPDGGFRAWTAGKFGVCVK